MLRDRVDVRDGKDLTGYLLLMITRTNKTVILGITLILFTALLSFLIENGLLKEWSDAAVDASQRINPILVIVLCAVLPAFGFPITLVYLAAGLRFGSNWGFVVITGCTFFHIFLPYAITRRLLDHPLTRWMARSRHKLPVTSSTNGWFISLLAALFPGIPYFMRNYLLGLTRVPLRLILAVCWPIYALRSLIVIYAGDASHVWDSKKVIIVVVIYGMKLGICGWLVLKLKASLKQTPAF
ncbi:MAG: associated Golgi protein [Verrucomicrobiales bacterium]|nr:associated Golgi protein [Verrucomicrobiales bacterium]